MSKLKEKLNEELKEELKGKSGIYVLRNLVNNKAYIGSAVDLERRMKEHFKSNGVNNQHNQYLNRSFAKYGWWNFFTIYGWKIWYGCFW